MSDVKTFIVLQSNALAQQGRYLAAGEHVLMEEHVARQEFHGRLSYEDGRVVLPWQPPTELETLVAELPNRRAHERLHLLQERRADILLNGVMSEDEHGKAVADAEAEIELDAARHAARDEVRAAASELDASRMDPDFGGFKEIGVTGDAQAGIVEGALADPQAAEVPAPPTSETEADTSARKGRRG